MYSNFKKFSYFEFVKNTLIVNRKKKKKNQRLKIYHTVSELSNYTYRSF